MKTLSQQHTSCSGLWKCFTRLLAASLRSSCTSAECIPDGKHRNVNVFTVFMRKRVRPEHDLLLQHKQTSRSGIVLKNVLFVSDVLLRPPSDPSTALTLWDGDASSGGVPDHRPASSSAPGDTSWPIRTLSRLPSPTPLPSHRPHGNLQQENSFISHIFYFCISLGCRSYD